MAIPEFTAEASLCRSRGSHRTSGRLDRPAPGVHAASHVDQACLAACKKDCGSVCGGETGPARSACVKECNRENASCTSTCTVADGGTSGGGGSTGPGGCDPGMTAFCEQAVAICGPPCVSTFVNNPNASWCGCMVPCVGQLTRFFPDCRACVKFGC